MFNIFKKKSKHPKNLPILPQELGITLISDFQKKNQKFSNIFLNFQKTTYFFVSVLYKILQVPYSVFQAAPLMGRRKPAGQRFP